MPSNIPLRGVRMDDNLYLKIKYIAKQENRSYNQQAVYVLKQFVEIYEKQNGKIEVDENSLYE